MGQLKIDEALLDAIETADSETWNSGFFRINPLTLLFGAFWEPTSPLQDYVEEINGAITESDFDDTYYAFIQEEQKKLYTVDTEMYDLVMKGKSPREAIDIVNKKRNADEITGEYENLDGKMTEEELARKKLADSAELLQNMIAQNALTDEDDDEDDDEKENTENAINMIRFKREKGTVRMPNNGKIQTSAARKVRDLYTTIFGGYLDGSVWEGDLFIIDFEDFTISTYTDEEKGIDFLDESFSFNETAFETICKALLTMHRLGSDTLTLDHLLYAMFETPLGVIRAFFEKLYIKKEDLYKRFCEGKDKLNIKKPKGYNDITIPSDLKAFVKSLTGEVLEKKKCIYGGREKETQEIYRILQKRTKKNAILIGEAGVGKTSVAKKIAWDIAKGKAPKAFKDMTVLSLDVSGSVAGTTYRGEAEEHFKKVADFLEQHPNVILFIDEVHLVVGAGATKEGDVDLANVLKPILAEGKTMVIGATTKAEYEKYFRKDSAFARRFNVVEVKEPRIDEVYGMLKKSIADLKVYHGINISKAMCDHIITMATCFKGEVHNPDRTIDLIDLSMVHAKELGKKRVDKQAVHNALKDYYDKFEKMSDLEKKKTAYHEGAHYLLAKTMPSMQCKEPVLVTIMPGDGYLGYTAVEQKEDQFEQTDYKAHIEKIAFLLAGRAAEEEVFNEINAGASDDLDRANDIARAMVYDYAMSKSGKNKVQVFKENGEFKMFSQKEIKKLNKQISEILNEAYDYALKVIRENRETLDKVVEILLSKGVVTEKELREVIDIQAYDGYTDEMLVVAKSGDDCSKANSLQ